MNDDRLRELGQALSARYYSRRAELGRHEGGTQQLITELGELLHQAESNPLGLMAEHRERASRAIAPATGIASANPATAKSEPDDNYGWGAIVARAAAHLAPARAGSVQRRDKP